MQRVHRSRLIGRELSLARLGEALETAEAGVPTTIVVGGEAGIGKSRLIEEFIESLPDDVAVAKGQCVDLGADAPPYSPISGVLRALVERVGEQAMLDAAGPAAEAIGVLLPALAVSGAGRGGGAERLYEAIAVTLENIAADQPIVIVVEDVHWADTATLALLRFLVRVVEHGRLLFLLTWRTDDVRRDHPLTRWLPELERSSATRRIDLDRLDRGQVEALIASRLGLQLAASDLTSIFSRSEGNPFFVEELADADQTGDGDLPPSLRDVLLARYEGLSAPTRRVMRIIAAGGSRVEHELLQEVFDGESTALDDAAREAVQANLISADDRAYQFRHALVRDAVHAELLPGERVRFHSAYAAALEDGAERASPEVSYHWMVAHDSRAAFRASVAAMDRAHGEFAYATAARMGERALELWNLVPDAEDLSHGSRRDLLARTAYDFRNAGVSERAIALVEEALADSDPADRVGRATLLRDKASYLANLGRVGSIDLLEEAVALLDGEGPSLTRAIALGELGARLMLAGRTREAIRTTDLALEQARTVDSRPRMSVALNIRGTSKVVTGDIDSGLADLAAAGELAVGDDSARLRYRVNLSDALHVVGRYDEAVAVAVEGTENARRRGLERTSGAIMMSNTVEPLLALGQWERANEIVDRALALEPPIGFSAHLQRLKLWWRLWSGDPDGAARQLRRWHRSLNLQLQTELQARLALARVSAEIALENGDLGAAWSEASAVLASDRGSMPVYDLPLLTVAARVLAAARADPGSLPEVDLDALEKDLRAVLDRSERWPTRAPFAALFEAELSGESVETWSAAVAAAEDGIAHAHMRPYAQVRLAEALALAGRRSDAEQYLVAAIDRAREIGAGLIVTRAETLRRRLGATSAGRSSSLGGLTEREQQVIELVSQGLSNGEIAKRLFISPKTASVHVSSILRKLGAASRTEAVYLAARGTTAIDS